MNRLMILFILPIITCALQSPTLQAAEKPKPAELHNLKSFKNADALTVINAFETQLDHYNKAATIDLAWHANFTQWLTPEMISILKQSKDFPLVKEYLETNLANKLQRTLEISTCLADGPVAFPLLNRGPLRQSIYELSPKLYDQLRVKNPATRSMSDSTILMLRKSTAKKKADEEYSFETATIINHMPEADNKEGKEEAPKHTLRALRKTVSHDSLTELD